MRKYKKKCGFDIFVTKVEINCEVEESFAEEWSKTQKQLMIKAGQEIIKIVPVEVDCKITDHWKK